MIKVNYESAWEELRERFGEEYIKFEGGDLTGDVMTEVLLRHTHKLNDYLEIEKIFIDTDVYIHRIEIGEELRKVNPLQGKYIDGYKQCYEDIRNRIIELIKSK